MALAPMERELSRFVYDDDYQAFLEWKRRRRDKTISVLQEEPQHVSREEEAEGAAKASAERKISRAKFREEEEEAKEKYDKCKTFAFLFIGVITLLFSLCEIGVGVWLGTLVLLSDGFHNLSDVVALGIGLWASKSARKEATHQFSYGTKRTELVGALINGSFLLALALYITLETIPRFISPEAVSPPGVTFIVIAAVGLAINITGTIVFAVTGRGHSHSHRHGDEIVAVSENESHVPHSEDRISHKANDVGSAHKGVDLNVRAVFLHFLGDALSSIFVLITAILLYCFPSAQNHWVLYMDPAASLVVVIIILWTSIPLVRTVGRILLQSTPTELDVPKLRQELTNIEGVISIHDLHIWQLVDGMTIASLHVDCRAGSDVAAITSHVKQIFHKFSIHSVTIQIELVPASHSGNAVCVEMCVEDCFEDWCCGDVKIIEDAALLDNIHGN